MANTPDLFRAAIRSQWTPERFIEMLEEMASSETVRAQDVECKSCRKSFSYRLPAYDTKARMDAMKLIAEHGYGRSVQAKEEVVSSVDLSVDVQGLSSAERRALRAQLEARLAPDAGVTSGAS